MLGPPAMANKYWCGWTCSTVSFSVQFRLRHYHCCASAHVCSWSCHLVACRAAMVRSARSVASAASARACAAASAAIAASCCSCTRQVGPRPFDLCPDATCRRNDIVSNKFCFDPRRGPAVSEARGFGGAGSSEQTPPAPLIEKLHWMFTVRNSHTQRAEQCSKCRFERSVRRRRHPAAPAAPH